MPGKIDEKGKQGTFRETRVSDKHTHHDGKEGYDVDIVDRTYVDNTSVRESPKVERIHIYGDERPKDHDDSAAVKQMQDYQEKQSSSEGSDKDSSDGGSSSGK